MPEVRLNQLPIDPEDLLRALVLERQLQNLTIYSQNFADAFNLSHWCERGPDHLFYWRLVAGRDGAMSLYHFKESLDAVRRTVGTVKIFNGLMPPDLRTTLRAAVKQLRNSFPGIEKLRHSVAHNSELTGTSSKYDKQWIRAKFGRADHPAIRVAAGKSFLIEDVFVGDTFMNTREGEIVQYDLTETSVRILIELTNKVYQAIQPLLMPEEL